MNNITWTGGDVNLDQHFYSETLYEYGRTRITILTTWGYRSVEHCVSYLPQPEDWTSCLVPRASSPIGCWCWCQREGATWAPPCCHHSSWHGGSCQRAGTCLPGAPLGSQTPGLRRECSSIKTLSKITSNVLKIHNMMISVSCHSIGVGSICFHTVYHHHFKQVHNTAMPTLTAPHPYLVYLLTWTLLQKAVSVMAHNGLLFRLIQPDKRLDWTFKGQADYFEYQYLISPTQNNLFCDHFRLFIMKCTVYMLTSEK